MSDIIEVQVVPDEEAGTVPPSDLMSILTSEEDLQKVSSYLKQEYDKAASEMDARNKKAVKWRTNLEAFASDAPKRNPMPNSSNVTIPLTQTVVQNLFAKIKGTFDALDPLWTVDYQLKDSESVRMMKVVEKYMTLLATSPDDLDLERVKNDLFMETILVGACFPKVVWSTNKWRVLDPSGAERQVTYHDGPEIVITPIEQVKYRRGVNTIERLPWLACDTPLTETELREAAAHGELDADGVNTILNQLRTDPNDAEAQRQKAEWTDQTEQTGLFDISEFLFYWDIDGTGVPVDLFFTMHVPTGTILRQQYNSLGVRFVLSARYMHRSNSITGRGAGQMTEAMNAEATDVHNLMNDNMKVANMRMFAVSKSSGLTSQEQAYPGRFIALDDPSRDIHAIPIGEIYPSGEQAESKSWAIAQRAVGLSDTAMGFADQTLGSRDTARGQAMRLQQGDTILGTVSEGLKTTLNQIAMLVWLQLVANKERVMARERESKRLSDDDLALLDKALNLPPGQVPSRLTFSIRTTDAEKTFEQRRQNLLALSQLYTQFATQSLPLATQLYGPAGMQMLQSAPELFKYMERMLLGSAKIMEDVFTFFGVKNTQDYVPDQAMMDKLLQTLGQIGQSFAQGMGGMPQPGNGAAGGPVPPSMAGGGGGVPAMPYPGGMGTAGGMPQGPGAMSGGMF